MEHKCFLPPFTVEPVLTLQEAQQKAGWNITAFNLPEYWKTTEGEGVKIAVLDTGCDLDHPDLQANLIDGKNFIERNEPPVDNNGHGTHCCGILSALNNEIGMVGVAPKAKIIPVKVLDGQGNGKLDVVSEGIYWAADNGADIISMSLGAPMPLNIVLKAIQYAALKGVTTFCAAGNAGNTSEIYYPAAYAETIAIGSIDENFSRSSFSNTGNNLDFMAPGGAIFSTYPPNWYAVLSGTSMACPFAVGVAALALSHTRQHKEKLLTSANDYRQMFRENTIPISNPEYAGKKFFQGFGIIDPRKLAEWVDRHLTD